MREESLGPRALLQLLVGHASRNPSRLVATEGNSRHTYADLLADSRALGRDLVRRNLRAGSVVGIFGPASYDYLCALYGVFWAGADALPLHPEHPKAHCSRMCRAAGPQLVLETSAVRWGDKEIPSVSVAEFLQREREISTEFQSTSESVEPAETILNESGVIFFTSGSTGIPKGVRLGPDSLSSFVVNGIHEFSISADDVFCQIAKPTFSISLFDFLLPIAAGASVRFLNPETLLEPRLLAETLRQCSVMHAGPALLGSLFAWLEEHPEFGPFLQMRHVSTGGDRVTPRMMGCMKEIFPRSELFVVYGCTEIACLGTRYRFQNPPETPPESISLERSYVGEAFPGMTCELLDDDGRPVRDGEEGEIVFSGRAVSAGYFNASETAAKAFFRRPEKGDIWSYRTGDYGVRRKGPSGPIEFIGRRDFQVKVRGIRIELCAIEQAFVRSGLARECVVVQRPLVTTQDSLQNPDNTSEKRLVAFFLPRCESKRHLSSAEINRIIGQDLPPEYLPALSVPLAHMPLNMNGKIDRRRLLTRTLTLPTFALPTASRPCADTTLEEVLGVMENLLETGRVAPDDHFFFSGGHSLMAVSLCARLEERFQVPLTARDVFLNPTALGLSRLIISRKAKGQDAQFDCRPILMGTFSPEKPDLYLLSGAHIYRSLAAALEPDWNLYSLVSDQECPKPEQKGVSKQLSVNSIADDYIRAIMKFHRGGPIHLLGYSFGGLIAYEVHKRLRTSASLQVGELILIDAILPEWALGLRYRLMQAKRLMGMSQKDCQRALVCLLRTLGKKTLDAVGRRIRFAGMGLIFGSSASFAFATDDHQRSHLKKRKLTLSSQYTGELEQLDHLRIASKDHAAKDWFALLRSADRRIPAATLFVADEWRRKKPLSSRSFCWDDYVMNLRRHEVPANHYSIVEDDEAVRAIAESLRRGISSGERVST